MLDFLSSPMKYVFRNSSCLLLFYQSRGFCLKWGDYTSGVYVSGDRG